MNDTQRLRLAPLALAAVVALPVLAAHAAEVPEDRVVRSAEGLAPQTGARVPRVLEERSVAAADVVTKPRSGTRMQSRTAALAADEAWFFDATTEMFDDYDGDGYFRFLRVRFDADTVWPMADVYAEIYLSADGETWELLHSTEDFTIYSSSPDDDYEVETELVSGYITALYDVLVELYDSETSEFVAEYGPAQSSAFSLVPLEDAYRDGVPPEPEPPIFDEGGSGSVGWAALPFLAGLLAARRRKRGATSATAR